MKRRLVLFGLLVLVVIATAGFAPRALRHVEFFRMRQVELIGLRYLAPDQVLATLNLGPVQHLFDPTDDIERRAEAIPGVVDVEVQRRLPGTLRFVFAEEVPVAFAPGAAGLVPLDGACRPLPYDPALTGFDLPLVQRVDTLVVRALALVRAADSSLFHEVDAARRGAGGAVVLELGGRSVLLPAVPTRSDIYAVGAVRDQLMRSGRPYQALDARFAGWVVVRRGRV
ncbi:MAG: FtsQ-type POTRA domain-containing protein [Gemmatimonadota bacterium]|nr:MAG: FtsQ-type POTRA domain-containing protein [Gemmatimonadota bacterium]